MAINRAFHLPELMYLLLSHLQENLLFYKSFKNKLSTQTSVPGHEPLLLQDHHGK